MRRVTWLDLTLYLSCTVGIMVSLIWGTILATSPDPAPRENREAINGFIERDRWHVEQITTMQAHMATTDAALATLQAPTPVPSTTPTPTPTATPLPWWWPMFEPTPTEGIVR